MSALTKYMDEGRHYHSFVHIGKMFADLYMHFHEYQDNVALKFAVAYHDVIYDAGSLDNEFWSAEVAATEMMYRRQYSDEIIQETKRLIMLTKGHQTTSDDEVGKVMIDLDLAGLASNRLQYMKNSDLVKLEYSGISQDQWLQGRKAFLESFLARNFIYQTDQARREWEDHARDNMQYELDYVNRKLIESEAT